MNVENFQSNEKKLEKSNWYEKCKNRPWEKFGISKSLYYYRIANGIPLDKHKYKDKYEKRYSGSAYDTPPQRIAEIKMKYRNGITNEILREFVDEIKFL